MHPTTSHVRPWFIGIFLLPVVLFFFRNVAAADTVLDGEWSGSFSCGEYIDTSFTLKLDSTETGLLLGELHFTVPKHPEKSGAYSVRGRYSAANRQISILPTQWIERQPGFPAVGLNGTVHENGLSMQGELRYCEQLGQRKFIAKRTTAALSSAAAGMNAQPLPAPNRSPLEGHWKGSITCKNSAVEIPLDFDILGDGSTIGGMATISWPWVKKRQVFYNDERFALGGQTSTEEVSLLPTVLLNPRMLSGNSTSRFRSLTGKLDATGKQIKGTAEKVAATWRCDSFQLNYQGPPRLPDLNGTGISAGSWAGYELDLKSTAGPLDQISKLNQDFSMQERLTLVGEGINMYGRYEIVRPIYSQPTLQEHYCVRLRPLLTLEDGRIGFVPLEVERAEGRLAGQSKRGMLGDFILALKRGAGDALMIERITPRPPRQGENTVTRLQRLGPPAIAALNAGEGPRVDFSPSIGGRLVEAASLDGQCRVLQDWLQPLSDAGDLGRMNYNSTLPHALPLFTDQHFVPVFGLPFQQTTQEERSALSSVMVLCSVRLKADVLVNPFVGRPFSGQVGFDEFSAKLMDREESKTWFTTAMAEIESIAERKDSLARLSAIEADFRSRNQDLSKSDREQFAAAIAGKRKAIAVAVLMDRVAAVPSLPATTASISVLRELMGDSRHLELPPEVSSTLNRLAQAKAKNIFNPIIAAAREAVRNTPKTLQGLAKLNLVQRKLMEAVNNLGPFIVVDDAAEVASSVQARREKLIASPDIHTAFTELMRGLKPQGDPRTIVHETALHYVDEKYLGTSSPEPAYAKAAEAAVQRLEIESITIADRSVPSSPEEPDAREILFALKAKVDMINSQSHSNYERCRNGQYENDPLMAMECLGTLTAGAGSEMWISITRFEKLGCAKPQGLPGYICDYVLGVNSDNPFWRGRAAEVFGAGFMERGRFLRTRDGWTFMGGK